MKEGKMVGRARCNLAYKKKYTKKKNKNKFSFHALCRMN